MYESFAGRHAIITGGSSGIGLALVHLLATANAAVSVLALDDADLAHLADGSAAGVGTFPVDVTDRARVFDAVAEAEQVSGPTDLVVTCAGVTGPGYFTHLDHREFEREMQVNYFGILWTIRAVAPSMLARRRGAIVAISSFAGLLGLFGSTAYCPSKFAVRGLCESLHAELKPHGIHVGCVFPPDTDTPMLARENPMKPPEAQASSMLRVLSAEHVARAVMHGAEHRQARVFPGRRTSLLARHGVPGPDRSRHRPGRREGTSGGPGGPRPPTATPRRSPGSSRSGASGRGWV